uniref:Uncharacterized protein n=1 Tax=Ascaris lumbricoides TaxID=6252 RepID=A0A9J2NZK8_ASCLU
MKTIDMSARLDQLAVPRVQSNSCPCSEIASMKDELTQVKNAVAALEIEKCCLRRGIYKLKVVNTKMKSKLAELRQAVASIREPVSNNLGPSEAELDYDDIGKNFILVGGTRDPFSLYFEASIYDEEGIEHRSAYSYYCYKMAEYFGDKESMKKILGAYSNKRVRKIADRIAGFNAAIWEQVGPFELWTVSSAHMVDALLLIICACLGSAMTGASVLLLYGYMASSFQVKQSVWEAGQRLKFEQIGWIAKVLVCTGNAYIAVCERDKLFGTGWSKYRSEADKPVFWDGQNRGGKFLMGLRHKMNGTLEWFGEAEKLVWRLFCRNGFMSKRCVHWLPIILQEMWERHEELKKFIWCRIRKNPRVFVPRGGDHRSCTSYL